ncbi:MAG: TldD/PmbA family protein [Candidatus Eisenbacteria sp.]|nr:TldD/PmbA family protein [Candidatus Eisenbacteria bacterium]
MSRELLQKAHDVIRIAKRAGALGARASVYRNRNSEVEWLDGRLDRIRQSTSMGVSISLFVDERYSAHSTSDLRPDALESFVTDAVGMTRLLAADPHRKLADPAYYANRFEGDLGLYDAPGAASVTGIDRRRTAGALEDSARSAPGGEKIITVNSSCSDSTYETALVNSNGMEGTARGTSFFLFADVTVRDQGDRRPSGYWYSVGLHRDNLEPVEVVGRKATQRALEGIGEQPMESGTYACVIENRLARRTLGGLLGALSGNAIQQERSFLAGKIGDEIASPLFSLTDDPLVVGGFGSRAYDNEGMTARKLPIFEKGVLRNYYLDTYYASKLGMKPTTGSQSNLLFTTGDEDLEGLLRSMGTGILITGLMGGNSNDTTGDFSVGIRGHWIENGKRVRPLSEMNMAGNHLESWKHLVEVGNDPWRYSAARAPSMRFDELTFSGA